MRNLPPPHPDQPPESERDRKLRRRRELRAEAAFRLEREVERQEACGHRDWDALVEAVLEGTDPTDVLGLR